MDKQLIREMISRALKMRSFSYAPYSHFAVGACLYTSDGFLYDGCNVENAAYGSTICAERTAIVKAASEGHRSLRAIVIVGGNVSGAPEDLCPPCGSCRQVMAEFAASDFEVILAIDEEHYRVFSFDEILPSRFDAGNL